MDNIVGTVGGDAGIAGRAALEQKADGSIKAPENIIMTATAARTYYQNYRSTHLERIRKYAAVEGLIAGNAPYDAGKLAAAGLSHITNVNTLDAKGLYEGAASAFFNLYHQVNSLVKFEIKPLEGVDADHEWTRWAKILEKNWTKVIRKHWKDFGTEMNTLTGQLVKFGLSLCVWSDEQDFRWKTVDISRFFVADQTQVSKVNWDCVCIETVYTYQYLYSVYKTLDDDDKKNSGWKKKELETLLIARANNANKGTSEGQYANMLDFQRRMADGGVNHGSIFSDSLTLVTMLYKEYSEAISHYIFDPRADANDFLFMQSGQFESFDEVLTLFTYSPGEFYVHSNRGVGHKIFPVCQALVQMDCHMFDMVKTAATPVIKSNSTVGKDVAPIRFIPGVAVDIGQAEFVQNNTGSNIAQLVPVAQYMDSKVRRNAMLGGDDPSQPDSDRGSKSAPEVTMNSYKEFGIGKLNIAHFYDKWDDVVTNMTIKMLHCKEGHPGYKIVKKWKERCIAEGVPEKIFETGKAEKNEMPEHLEVRASRAAGDGSDLSMIMGLSRLQPFVGRFGAKGQANFTEDMITTSMGEDYVDRYTSDSEDPDESAGGASLAALENIAMRNGESPQVTKDNQHRSHLASHLAFLMELIKAVQAQQIDPIAADQQFELAINHGGEHIGFLSADILNEDFIKQIEGPWKQINKFAQLNRVRAQKMQQTELRRRAEEEQAMTADQMEANRKDMVAKRDEDRKDFKVAATVERAKEASETRAEVMKSSVEKKAENERLAVQLKHGVDKQKASNEVSIKKPQELLANTSSDQLQQNLVKQVGTTPNPVDFK